VTRDRLLERLARAGLEAPDALRRAALVAQTRQAFVAATGGQPRWGWVVPGRIEIFGKHTDYAGGRSLVAAVPRGFVVMAGPRADGRVRAIDARWGGVMEVDPHDTTPAYSGWSRYVAVVARRLAHNFPGADLGADIVLASDLPRAAGLSSSSALVVGVGTALIRRGALEARADWRQAIRTREDLAGYLGAVENGLSVPGLPGTGGVGTHGGSEDHTAILAGRAGRVSAYAYVPVRPVGDAAMPEAWRFIVATSGVQADKAGSARERYNRASLGARALVEIWNAAGGRAQPTLAALLAAEPDARAALPGLIAASARADFDAADLARRLAHFVAEDGRILPAVRAFRDADAATTTELARASQTDADRLLGNQIDETRELARLAAGAGAFAASSFGAGFGGSVWALAPAGEADAVAARWLRAYTGGVHAPKGVEVFHARPGPGVIDLALDEEGRAGGDG
jgi:galactokinase